MASALLLKDFEGTFGPMISGTKSAKALLFLAVIVPGLIGYGIGAPISQENPNFNPPIPLPHLPPIYQPRLEFPIPKGDPVNSPDLVFDNEWHLKFINNEGFKLLILELERLREKQVVPCQCGDPVRPETVDPIPSNGSADVPPAIDIPHTPNPDIIEIDRLPAEEVSRLGIDLTRVRPAEQEDEDNDCYFAGTCDDENGDNEGVENKIEQPSSTDKDKNETVPEQTKVEKEPDSSKPGRGRGPAVVSPDVAADQSKPIDPSLPIDDIKNIKSPLSEKQLSVQNLAIDKTFDVVKRNRPGTDLRIISSTFRLNSDAHMRGAFDIRVKDSPDPHMEAKLISQSLGPRFVVILEQPIGSKSEMSKEGKMISVFDKQTNNSFRSGKLLAGYPKTENWGKRPFRASGEHIHVQPDADLVK